MIYIQWSIIIFVVLVSLIAWYFQMKIHSNIKAFNVSNTVFSSWVFKPDNLNEEGQIYRKKIFICWLLIFIFAIIYFSIS